MKLNNTYYMLRHGQAISNTKDTMSSWPETFDNPLTEVGVGMAQEAAKALKAKSIDLIFASDVLRAKQTAEIVAKALGIEIIFDERLREINFGSFNGKNLKELEELAGLKLHGFADGIENLKRWVKPGGNFPGYGVAGGEDYSLVQKRVFGFLQNIDARYTGKNILIVSHQSLLCLLEEKAKDIPLMQIGKKIPGYLQMHTGEVRALTADN